MSVIAMLTVGILLGAVLADEGTAAETPRQTPGHMQRTIQKTVELPYLLYLPDGYETDKRQWPVLLFLHGSGSRGTELDSVKIDGPPKMIEEGYEFPFIVVSPQCPAEEWWTADVLEAMLDEIIEIYRVDEDRVYVTGLSMGGTGTWKRHWKFIQSRVNTAVL